MPDFLIFLLLLVLLFFNSIENDMFLINFMIIKIFAEVLFMQISLIVESTDDESGLSVWTLRSIIHKIVSLIYSYFDCIRLLPLFYGRPVHICATFIERSMNQ